MTANTSKVSNGCSTTSSTIPTIDFTPFMKEEGIVVGQDPTPAQLQVAQAIDAACRDHGFLYLTNFGLSKADRDEIFAASAALFSLDEEVKKTQLRPIHSVDNMGYAALYSESHNKSRPPESKEAFNVRFPPTNHNNLQGCPERFCAAQARLRSIMTDTCRRYCLACALALGLAPDFFHQTFEAMQLCTIRFLHYPPCDYQEPTSDENNLGRLRIGEHTDFGLGDDGADGLQVKPVQGAEIGGAAGGEEDGSWLDVRVPLPGESETVGAVVNTGALMARWTNDEWKASAHRVVVSSQAMADRERYATAFFADPDSETLVVVPDELVQGSVPKKYPPITSIDYLLEKLAALER